MRIAPTLPAVLFALAPTLALAPAPASAQAEAAQVEFTLVNANVVTVDPDRPRAQAVAVGGGRILAVGSTAEIRRFAAGSPGAVEHDLTGKTVIPGLIDAHGHLAGQGWAMDPANVDARDAAGPDEIAARVRKAAAGLPAGEWVLGRGWDQNRWTGQWKGRFPTAAELDAVAADRPVVLRRVDGHASWANTSALRIAGVNGKTGDPAGGRIMRDAAGRPTGVFIDSAMSLIERHVPGATAEQVRRRVLRAAHECARLGITCVHDAGLDATAYRALTAAAAAGELPIRVYGMAGGGGSLFADLIKRGEPLLDADERVIVRAVKLFADGALGSRGAALLEPYSDEPGSRGLVLMTREQLLDRCRTAMRAGLQPCVHAIGDAANRTVLEVFEALLTERPEWRALRPRIEHCQVLSPADIPRFAKIGLVASIQPTHATSDMPWAPARLGPVRVKGAYAYRSLLEAGARAAGGSDFPVEEVNPFLGLYAAVARQDVSGKPAGGWLPEQRLSREQALRLFTLDAAYAGHAERTLGSIAAGKRADLAVLNRDVLTCAVQEIPRIVVERTYLGGRPVHGAGSRP
jgi:hypothetical protein